MVTLAAAESLRDAQSAVATLAVGELTSYWSRLDLSRAPIVKDALLEFVPALTSQYGEMSALLSVEWYDAERLAVGAPGRFSPDLGEPVDLDEVRRNADYASRHLFSSTPEDALAFLQGAVQKFTLQPGRDTIAAGIAADPAGMGWRRMARAEACAFCAYMASVLDQPDYERAAQKYHADCHCIPVVAFEGDEFPDQPNLDAWQGTFEAARRQIVEERKTLPGWSTLRRPDRSRLYPEHQITTKNILARARRIAPDQFTDGVRAA